MSDDQDYENIQTVVGKCGACGSPVTVGVVGSGVWCPDTQKQTTVVPVFGSPTEDTKRQGDDQRRERDEPKETR